MVWSPFRALRLHLPGARAAGLVLVEGGVDDVLHLAPEVEGTGGISWVKEHHGQVLPRVTQNRVLASPPQK